MTSEYVTQRSLSYSETRFASRLAIGLLVCVIIFVCSGRVSGSSDPNELEARAFAGSNQWNLASKREAVRLFLAAAGSWNEQLEFRKAADTTRNAASVALELRDFQQTRTLLNETIRMEVAYGYAEGEMISQSIRIELGVRSGNMQEAEVALKRLEQIELAAPHAEAEAARNFGKAEWEYARFNLPETIKFATEARRLWAETGNDARQIEANSLAAYAYGALHEPLQAEKFVNESLDLATRTGNERAKARIMAQMAFALALRNEPIRALDVCQKAEMMFPQDLDLGEKAGLLNGISGIYWMLGDMQSANSYSLKALDLFEREKSPRGQLATLISLIESSFSLGDPEKAFAFRRQAGILSEQLNNDYFIAIGDRFIANHYMRQGDYAIATRYYRKTLIRLNASGFKSGISSLHSNLGESLLRQAELKEARVHFEEAQEINQSVSDQFAEAQSLFDLARLSSAEGDPGTSDQLISKSLEITENLRDNVNNRRLRRDYFANVSDRYAFAVSSLVRRGLFEDALRLAERSRAREMVDNLTVTETGVFADADQAMFDRERSLRIALNAKTDKLTDQLQNGDNKQTVELEQEITELDHQLEMLSTEIKQRSPIYSETKDPTPFDSTQFRTNLIDDDSVMLEFHFGKEESYLWLVGQNDFSGFVLPARDVIEKKIAGLIELIEAGRIISPNLSADIPGQLGDGNAKFEQSARELSNMILGPVAEKIRGKRLIVVADGKLNYFPISALPMPNSESDDPILLTNEVIYQPSAQTYALLKKIGQERKDERTKDLLVFSDPVFNPADERLTGIEVAADKPEEQYRFRLVESFSSLSRLPASKTEAETVSNAVGGSDMYMGFDATRDRLLSTNLADYRVVHLATHGFLDPERPELSSLIFSRYDQTGKQIDESIRMQDIYSMKLNADLVVLSACQTGTGKEIKGEGVMGLNTAFLQAGARSVVSTLWQVEDNAANQLMKEFYGRMVSDGMSPSAALRAAQIKLYQDPQFRSPFFWAAFTVHGDAATATPFKRDHTKLFVGISAAVALGLVGFILLRRRRYRTSKV